MALRVGDDKGIKVMGAKDIVITALIAGAIGFAVGYFSFVSIKWPTLQDLTLLQAQLNAILSAPVPFILVCVAAVVVAWRIMEWLYKERMEKTTHLNTLANSELQIKTEIAARVEDELNKKIDDLEKKLSVAPEGSPELLTLAKDVSSIKSNFDELKQANNEVRALSGTGRVGGFTSTAVPTLHITMGNTPKK
jgi:hypothetical protein